VRDVGDQKTAIRAEVMMVADGVSPRMSRGVLAAKDHRLFSTIGHQNSLNNISPRPEHPFGSLSASHNFPNAFTEAHACTIAAVD